MIDSEAWVIIVSVVIVAVATVGDIVLDGYGCVSKWEGSGLDPQYKVFGGCTIKLPDGSRIPTSAYKVLK